MLPYGVGKPVGEAIGLDGDGAGDEWDSAEDDGHLVRAGGGGRGRGI